jgi:hypothetical protein
MAKSPEPSVGTWLSRDLADSEGKINVSRVRRPDDLKGFAAELSPA